MFPVYKTLFYMKTILVHNDVRGPSHIISFSWRKGLDKQEYLGVTRWGRKKTEKQNLAHNNGIGTFFNMTESQKKLASQEIWRSIQQTLLHFFLTEHTPPQNGTTRTIK